MKAKSGANARSGGIPFRPSNRRGNLDKLTSEAFVGMWRARVAEFYSKYMATAAAAGRVNR